MSYQQLNTFQMPPGFRGKSSLYVQLWWLVQAILFHPSPQVLYGWRRFLLRCFGARIGKGVILRPSVRITYPWKLTIEDYAWIGDHVDLYTLGTIHIGAHAVVSQKSYLCTGTHDYHHSSFPIQAYPIVIEPEVWIATDVFIGPGVIVGKGSVVGARSSVFKSIEGGWLYAGSPVVALRKREGVPTA
ncbi:MAG: putative colanic acid biosynthesis acetyltransferase [Cytophagaceae bacterium]|jgi:putative colanic acid biosynthesis acetyltransferase WcaF|nr:putative colanic acid biosynthesis acetyltransferase [Cytophagaceae bacterium]